MCRDTGWHSGCAKGREGGGGGGSTGPHWRQGHHALSSAARAAPVPRKSLCTTFMKNCEPPELGWPVLAMERVPGLLEILAAYSSLMLPPFERVSVAPVFRFLKVPSGGPPVPLRCDLGSLE